MKVLLFFAFLVCISFLARVRHHNEKNQEAIREYKDVQSQIRKAG